MSLEHSPARQGRGRLLHPPAAAEYLGFAVQTLARWRTEGGGPEYVKIGGRVLYEPAALEAFVASRRRTSTSKEAA